VELRQSSTVAAVKL